MTVDFVFNANETNVTLKCKKKNDEDDSCCTKYGPLYIFFKTFMKKYNDLFNYTKM